MGTINYIILHFGSFITNEAGFPKNKMWISKLRASWRLEEPEARTQEAQVALSTGNGGAKRSGRGKA